MFTNSFSLVCALSLLGVSFLSGAGTGIQVETVAKSTAMWTGETLPAYPEGQPEVTILKISIPPKDRLPLHLHPVINAGVLLSGDLVVHSESGDTRRLKPGDPLIELVDRWHYGENPGEVPAVILVFYAGIEGEPVTVLKDGTEGHTHDHQP